jgi:hypothetical protein
MYEWAGAVMQVTSLAAQAPKLCCLEMDLLVLIDRLRNYSLFAIVPVTAVTPPTRPSVEREWRNSKPLLSPFCFVPWRAGREKRTPSYHSDFSSQLVCSKPAGEFHFPASTLHTGFSTFCRQPLESLLHPPVRKSQSNPSPSYL